MFAERREIALGVALPQEYREVGDQSGELPVLAIRAGTEGMADMLDHVFSGMFHHRPRTASEQFSIR